MLFVFFLESWKTKNAAMLLDKPDAHKACITGQLGGCHNPVTLDKQSIHFTNGFQINLHHPLVFQCLGSAQRIATMSKQNGFMNMCLTHVNNKTMMFEY